jgi:hypothetical protein
LNLIRVTPAKGQDMQASIFLARLLGPAMLTVGVGILINQAYYRAMTRELVASRPMMFIVALIGVIGGLAVVLVHNVWTADWRVIITLLGWINLLRGLASLLLPEGTFDFAKGLMANKNMPMAAGVVMVLIGATLCFFGYFR